MNNGLIIDCFAGGGGASVGIEMALNQDVDIAINHDPAAIRMHKVNHKNTLHLTEDIFDVDLSDKCKNEHVSLLWASPDCRSFSKAKGSAPRSESVRMLPWAVYKHTKDLKPDMVFMENVEEIQKWGPLDEGGHIIKDRQGETYHKFIQSMTDLGYTFDSKELVAADYGAPTTRKRWYAVFRRDGKQILWPKQTNAKNGEYGLKPWVPCCKFVDWSDLGTSLFNRKRPLAKSTKRRIEQGLLAYLNDARSYKIENQATLDKLNTITPERSLSELGFTWSHVYDETEDLIALPFLIKYYGTGGGQLVTEPLATITTKDRFGLVTVVCRRTSGSMYTAVDMYLRMLKPEELKRMQGFPESYVIDHDINGKSIPKTDQTKRIGNSVVPTMAAAIIRANAS